MTRRCSIDRWRALGLAIVLVTAAGSVYLLWATDLLGWYVIVICAILFALAVIDLVRWWCRNSPRARR